MGRRYELVSIGDAETCKDRYIAKHGHHFSSALCEWAVAMMRRRNPVSRMEEQIERMHKDDVIAMLRKYGIDTSSFNCYDATYLANMAKADYLGSSIADETHLALFVKDYITDCDGYDGKAFVRFVADCKAQHICIPWEKVL